MKNNTLLKEELGTEQLLKLTALLYLKEALVNQEFETCPELIETAKKAGAEQEEISTILAEYLNVPAKVRQRQNRLRS